MLSYKIKLKLHSIPTRLVADANAGLASIINRFPHSHTPLLAYESREKFAGLLTAHNILRNRRFNQLTLIRSCLIMPPKLTVDSPIDEVLGSMSSLKLYTLPIFDSNEIVIGIVKAKTILRDLIKTEAFADLLVKKVPRRAVITIKENSNIGDAFQLFSKHAISRLIVVDENRKLKGIVSKRDIMSLYFASTDRQRFSSRSHQKNYSFDTEKVKRDHEPLMKYVSPVLDTLDATISTDLAVSKLLENAYNSIILVDKNRIPHYLFSTKDVLREATKILRKHPYLLVITSNLPEELSQIEKDKVSEDLRKIASWVNKQQKLQLVRFATKITYSPESKPIVFEVKLKITTDSGEYFAKNKDRDFLSAVQGVVNQVKKQVRRLNS